MVPKILTSFQHEVLISLFEKGLGEKGFFLTGGTALAEFYLHHRYSDDLDFFTRKTGNLKKDFDEFLTVLDSLGFIAEIQRRYEETLTVSVYSSTQVGNKLKLEFNRDGTPRMAPSSHFENVVVDSFEDIAVNKVCTILSRGPHEPKDFIDLYFILTESQFSLDFLIGRAREKEAAFDQEEGILEFAIRLRGVKEPLIMPRMVKPLSHEMLSNYLTPLADGLIRRLGPRR